MIDHSLVDQHEPTKHRVRIASVNDNHVDQGEGTQQLRVQVFLGAAHLNAARGANQDEEGNDEGPEPLGREEHDVVVQVWLLYFQLWRHLDDDEAEDTVHQPQRTAYHVHELLGALFLPLLRVLLKLKVTP